MHTKFSRTFFLSLSLFPKSPKLTYHYFLRWSVNFCHFFNLGLKSSVQFKISSIYRCWRLVPVISLSSVGLICHEFWSIGDFIIWILLFFFLNHCEILWVCGEDSESLSHVTVLGGNRTPRRWKLPSMLLENSSNGIFKRSTTPIWPENPSQNRPH